MSARGRSRWVWAAATVGAVLALSSTALACTAFYGKMVITGNASTGVVTVIGNNQPMSWCPGYPMGKAKATRGGSVTVTVKKAGIDAEEAGCVPRGSRLPQGTYNVNYQNGKAFTRSDKFDKDNSDGSRGWEIDCMSGVGGSTSAVTIGTLQVDAFGKGTGTFRIPTGGVVSGPTDEAAICVSDMVGGDGNQAPLTIV